MSRLATAGPALALVALLGFPLAGCSAPAVSETQPAQESAGPTRSPAPTRKLVFDMGHREIFGPTDETDLGQSQAVARMEAAGFDVTVNDDTITPEDLEGASGLFLPGPMIPLQDSEYDTITAFAESGGTVVMTIHVPYPVLKVPAHWGLPVETFVLLSEKPYSGNDASVFPATGIQESRLTEGVSELAIVSGWPVKTASESAEYVIKTDEYAWVDINENGARDAGEEGPFGVVAATRIGEGIIIVIGDDAVFANLAIGQPGNARFLDNILELMRGSLDV